MLFVVLVFSWTARIFLETLQVAVCRKILQNVRELLCVYAAEDAPERIGDGDYHPVIGL